MRCPACGIMVLVSKLSINETGGRGGAPPPPEGRPAAAPHAVLSAAP